MKRRIQLFLIILSLGVLVLPQQNFAAQTFEMDCCESQSTSQDSCHHSEKNANSTCELPSSSDQDCKTQCAKHCTVCLHAGIPLFKSTVSELEVSNQVTASIAVYSYLQPEFSSASHDIWQPPKLG